MVSRLLTMVAAIAVLAACSAQGSTGSSPADPPGTASGAPSQVATSSPATPGTTSAPTAQPQTLPDGSRRLFPGHRVVAYYGAAGAPALGVLGTAGPDGIWPRLARQAKAYDRPGMRVLPAYELITYLASGSAGRDGSWAHRVPDSVIGRYVAAAKRHQALVILDIQPGRGRFLPDAKSLARWLRLPDVALALDPEWKLYGQQRPDRQIGHTDAATVNAVSGWLDALTAAAHLPQKLLLIHQFTDDMVRHKSSVVTRPHLAMTFNMDGFGGRAAKLSRYRALARDRTFPLGMKLFYQHDVDIFSPRQTMALRPSPDVVDYE